MFNDLRRGWWYFIIDKIILEWIGFLIKHISQIKQSTSSSEYLFFSLPLDFFTCQLHYDATSTYQPHHYSSTSLIPIIIDFLLFRVLNLLRASLLFPSFHLFLVFLWMLWMLDTTYKAKPILWNTLIMFIA